ncbi:mitochondrial 37S ribosomal protein bS21m [Aspergillus ibericus CBS 121593]|uniref:Ribosomal protein S21 n=1 Tax=Aspergillus ibericus CBS 121593 TaxID=1448316 RepID=A0A395H8G7_9EURO|nr:hypothetical protein BO80DRAFT_422909 [Aspergillus ibericus CBS 121593]RAL03445.1 hypothetical protein BO80DRAFT_422909 [Aspergillus ibericus CBS 121593]
MERRALAQCLRSRPTTTLQLLPGRIGLRFASSGSNNNNTTTTTTTTTPPSAPAPTQSAPPSRTANRPQQPPAAATTDFDQILNKLNINTTTGTTRTSANERTPGSRVFNNDPLSVSRAVSQSAETDTLRAASRRVDLKLGPKLGRQITVEPEKGMDLPAALRGLTTVLNQNKVKASLQAQRFHIRKGQLRKNLKIKRWRYLFKFSFGATIKRIHKIRAQGW